MSDLIERQAAIDVERNATVDTNPSHFEAHQKFTQFMDDAEISSFGRWQWSNGFNTALTAVGIDLKKLPSAQPEPLPAASPWHRVEEPPTQEGKYLVCDELNSFYVVWWGPILGWCYDPKRFRYWMPIEPPKEENNGSSRKEASSDL